MGHLFAILAIAVAIAFQLLSIVFQNRANSELNM